MASPARYSAEMTLRVCQHRTCKSQGSHETLLMLKELAPRSFVVEACGCLGGCGHGPNIAAIPAAGTPLILPHVATPARVTKLLREVLQVDVHPDAAAALRWRIQGNNALQSGEYEEAVAHYNRAASIARDAGAACGLHLVLGNRAVARLALKDAQGALADAEAALDAAPRGWARGWLRKVTADPRAAVAWHSYPAGSSMVRSLAAGGRAAGAPAFRRGSASPGAGRGGRPGRGGYGGVCEPRGADGPGRRELT